MTLVCAWVRYKGASEELVVATDSRLTGGMTWDHGQKVFALPRGDSVLAFAGDTFYAYPLILQTLRYIEDYDRAECRAMPLEDMKGHVERVLTVLLQAVRDLPVGQRDLHPDFTLLLAGYSVAAKDWAIWVSEVDAASRQLRFTRAPRVGGHRGAVFVGSGAARAIATLKADRGAIWKRSGKRPPPLEWEPVDILRDMIASDTERSVGGPIQLVTVHSHLNVMPYAVFWPSRSERRITLFGRPLLDYERTQRLTVDVETHEVFKLWEYLDVPAPKKGRRRQRRRRGGGRYGQGSGST